MQSQPVQTPCSSTHRGQNGSAKLGLSIQTFIHSAMNKTEDSLPKSPRKKREVIRQASNFCFSMIWPHKQSRMTITTKETVDLEQNFDRRDDVSRIIPANRDVGTVKNVNGKAKHRKRHEHQGNVRNVQGRTSKCENRVKQICRITPSVCSVNVCQCAFHQNFIVAVDALHGCVRTITS